MTCRPVCDFGDAIAFLRRNVFSNNCILDALEHNNPPVPRQVYIAESEDGICGVMSVEDCGEWTVADLRAAGGTPTAMAALARQLEPGRTYRLSTRSEYWEAIRSELAQSEPVSTMVAMTVGLGSWREVVGPAQVRRLTSADRAVTDAYPAPAQRYQPTLSQFAAMAEEAPGSEAVFGALLSGQIAAYVLCSWVTDNVWEIGILETLEPLRRQGIGKQLLSVATEELLKQGRAPLYQTYDADTAGLRAAQAVGYSEVFRICSVDSELGLGSHL